MQWHFYEYYEFMWTFSRTSTTNVHMKATNKFHFVVLLFCNCFGKEKKNMQALNVTSGWNLKFMMNEYRD